MKEELIESGIIIDAYHEQLKGAEIWMTSEYVRDMESEDGGDYDIEYGSAIILPQILSLLLHCNFTLFCTLFSRGFRKLRADETDEELKERNSRLMQFAKNLIETVHAFGTRTAKSNIRVFYHGISIVMHFKSAVAVFCSPTSTTTGINIYYICIFLHFYILYIYILFVFKFIKHFL